LVETVGVGQTELDIMELADTTVVVLVPESGDAIQTMKAGLMEAADVFLVNKADRSGAPALMAELTFAAHLHRTSAASPKDIDWEIPVLSAEAQPDVGVAELLTEVRRHRLRLRPGRARAPLARRASRAAPRPDSRPRRSRPDARARPGAHALASVPRRHARDHVLGFPGVVYRHGPRDDRLRRHGAVLR